MSPVRLLLCIYCVVFGAGVSLMAAPSSVTDSLQGRLAHTSDPRERVQLLLNLKDLNEDTHLNLPYSIQLFREAADIRDTYAMSVSVIPILSRYSIYVEKEDTLRYYVQALRDLTPGTPEEGADAYAEMCIGFYRLGHQYDLAENLSPRTSTSAPNACSCAATPTSRSATTRAETGGPISRRPTRGAKPTS